MKYTFKYVGILIYAYSLFTDSKMTIVKLKIVYTNNKIVFPMRGGGIITQEIAWNGDTVGCNLKVEGGYLLYCVIT